MNTNSNTYTVIYASIVVVVVAFLLAFVSSVLKERQDANVVLDTKKQILSSLNVDYSTEDPAVLYDQVIKEEIKVDNVGNILPEGSEDGLTVFVADIDGATKYVIPMRGNGLWGPLWGYVSLNDDKDTVFGVYFSHESETPGLGAEITSDKFKQPFHGKHIKNDGKVVSFAVVKPGKSAEGCDYVDGLSGGTMTSQGVDDMLRSTFAKYEQFLMK